MATYDLMVLFKSDVDEIGQEAALLFFQDRLSPDTHLVRQDGVSKLVGVLTEAQKLVLDELRRNELKHCKWLSEF